ncbi:MAG: amino acid adenylation domain-containing protein [Chloroflexota bacterium]
MSTQRIEGFQLSSQQKRIWTLQQKESRIYSAQATVHIEGSLDPSRLREALTTAVERYEILRTTFQRMSGMEMPLQVITTLDTVRYHIHDFQHISTEDQEQRVRELAAMARGLINDSATEMLVVDLVQIGQTTWKLLLSLPSLCADVIGLHNLTHVLGELYASHNPLTPDEEVLQYVDFSEWQHEVLESPDTASGRAYWQQQYESTTGTRLPFELTPSQQTVFEPLSVNIILPPTLETTIDNFATEHGSDVSTVLLAAWLTLLSRLTNQPVLCTGVLCDGRQQDEITDALGLFARYLPLRQSIDKDAHFHEVMRMVSTAVQDLTAWQDYFVWEDYVPDDSERSFSWPVVFEWVSPLPPFKAEPCTFTLETANVLLDRFHLGLSCTRYTGRLVATLRYDPRYLAEDDVARLAEQYQTLLIDAIQHPQTSITMLKCIGPKEHQLRDAWQPVPSADWQPLCIHELITQQSRRTPEAPALVDAQQTLTYQDLEQRANQVAQRLQHLGVRPDTPVGLLLDRSVDMLVAMLGVLKAGGAYVPFDPTLPSDRLAIMLADLQTPIVVAHQHLRSRLVEGAYTFVILDDEATHLAQPVINPPVSRVTDNHLAYIIFTSGSTGQPKGVAITHRQLAAYTTAITEQLAISEGAHFATVSTFAADLGHTVIFSALVSGGCLHVIAQDRVTHAEELAIYMRDHPIDYMKIVPSHMAALLHTTNPDDILPKQCLILGGEATYWDLISRIRVVAPQCRILNHYGPTETTVGVLTHLVPDESNYQTATVPLGRPLPQTQIYLLDTYLQQVPIGAVGEIFISGEQVARGYVNRPGLTAERFVPNPFGTHSNTRMYRTGDLGRLYHDGTVEFLGRVDYQVKLRGYRIELGEIEATLGQHYSIQQAVVTVHEATPGDMKLVAYVVLLPDQTLSEENVQTFLTEQLPPYMLPALYVPLDTLPLSPNGKVDRQQLPEPHYDQPTKQMPHVAPQTTMETKLADIWANVLGHTSISIHDNFFSLGGDSILSIQVVAKANQAGISITPRQMFDYPTIAEVVAVVGDSPDIHAEQGLVTGMVPLTPIQHWFFEQHLPDAHHYNQSVLLEAQHPLDIDLIEQVISQLVLHHDALRLRFSTTSNGWEQTHGDVESSICVHHIDLAHLTDEQQHEAITASATRLQSQLNLTDGPLLQVVLYECGPDAPQRLLFIIHHLAVDGVSWRVLLEDFQTAYQQGMTGQTMQLPTKTTAFQHWAERLVAYADSTNLAQELDYWSRLATVPLSDMPRDYVSGANIVASIQSVTKTLDPAETRALTHEVPAVAQVQVQEMLMAALALAYAQWATSRTLLINLESHGRNSDLFADVDLSRTVGWCTSRFPFYLDIRDTYESGDVLRAVRGQLQQVPQGGLGYGVLCYLNNNPDFQAHLQAIPEAPISFNYFGQFNQLQQESGLLRVAQESPGPERSIQGIRRYLIDINSLIADGQLSIIWSYSTQIHRPETIEQFAIFFVTALRNLITHTLSSETADLIADLSGVDLDQEHLEQLIAKHGAFAEE